MPASPLSDVITWLVLAVGVLGAGTLGFGWAWWRLRVRSVRLAATLAEVDTQLGAARRDPVTGIMPRAEFDAAVEAAVRRCDAARRTLALLFVDVDNFSSINETLGHGVGDEVLRQLGARFHKAVPEQCAAMRLGGDQIVIATECGSERARELADILVREAGRAVDAGTGRSLQMSASVGVALYPQHGAQTVLVAHASNAMRSVKQAGGGAYAVFDPKIVIDVQEQARLLGELRQALAKRQLELVYQPKVDARSLQITAAEALLRWRHPARGLVSPAQFIPLAERHGLIGLIGNWVIEEACRQAGIWRRQGLRMRVAINLSAFQMRQDDLVERLQTALDANGLQPGRFTVEITESLALENTSATQRTFEGLRRTGLHVAIDDFGAGQTSLAYLRSLPASELKMDMSLVRDLESSEDARAIAEAVVKLGHALERRVVAEGVETTEQRDLLVEMGCDELQGYLFAKPMAASALALWAMNDEGVNRPEFRPSLFQETVPVDLD